MSDLYLTQTELNQSLRGESSADILMFIPDKNVCFPSNAVSINKEPLSYTTNLQSMIEFSSLPQANIATFENNSWVLDGSFISPSVAYGGGGDSYTGYISNDLTDDNGNYTTNPIISVTLSLVVPEVRYLSLRFAGGIDTSYPKVVKIRTYNNSDSLIQEHSYDMTTQTGLPLMVAQIGDTNVKRVEFELVGTKCPHRRSRLSKILFGKAEQINPYYLQSWKLDDKASLVADSIPTKTFEYNVINYDGDYDIDNPGNKIPNVYKDSLVLFTFGMEINGLWKYTPTKTFNLMDISTTPDGIVTFSCGSLLDILTDTYDRDNYGGVRTIKEIMDKLLIFSDVGTDQCLLNDFANWKINIPLPENPVREIIQKLAFSCGATLTVDDNNRVVFSKKNILDTTNSSKFVFTPQEQFDSAGILLEEPNAEALANTTNIAMYTYDSKILGSSISDDTMIGNNDYNVGSANISVITPTRITFSPVSGTVQFDRASLEDQHAAITPLEIYSQHAIVQLSWVEGVATPPIEVKLYGRKVETTQTIPKTVDMDTLLLDSGIAYQDKNQTLDVFLDRSKVSTPDPETFYYTDWYGAKFKYMCKTRNEYLIKAGDIILFETPFSNGEPNRVGYVLRNSYSDGDSGEMEVITIGNN